MEKLPLIPNPSPEGEGSPLSHWERVRVRATLSHSPPASQLSMLLEN
jgi:hypothetical protein